MHIGTAYQNTVGNGLLLGYGIQACGQLVMDHVRDGIQGLNFEHVCKPPCAQAFSISNCFMKATSFSTPALGMAL